MKTNGTVKTTIGVLVILLTIGGGGTITYLLNTTSYNSKLVARYGIEILHVKNDIKEIKASQKEELKLLHKIDKKLP